MKPDVYMTKKDFLNPGRMDHYNEGDYSANQDLDGIAVKLPVQWGTQPISPSLFANQGFFLMNGKKGDVIGIKISNNDRDSYQEVTLEIQGQRELFPEKLEALIEKHNFQLQVEK